MATGDYTKVSGIKGYDKLRKIAHEGGGSDFGGMFKKLRDKKKASVAKFDPNKFDPATASKEDIIAMQKKLGVEPDGDWGEISTDAYNAWKQHGDMAIAPAKTDDDSADQTTTKPEPKESFKERRARRKEEGKWYLGKYAEEGVKKAGIYADKFKELIRTEPSSDEPAFKSTLRPIGTIVKERQELKDKKRSETFAKNQQMAEDTDAKIKERLWQMQYDKDEAKALKQYEKDQYEQQRLAGGTSQEYETDSERNLRLWKAKQQEYLDSGVSEEIDTEAPVSEWSLDQAIKSELEDVFKGGDKAKVGGITAQDGPKGNMTEDEMRAMWEEKFEKMGIGFKDFVSKLKEVGASMKDMPQEFIKTIKKIPDAVRTDLAKPEGTLDDPANKDVRPLDPEGNELGLKKEKVVTLNNIKTLDDDNIHGESSFEDVQRFKSLKAEKTQANNIKIKEFANKKPEVKRQVDDMMEILKHISYDYSGDSKAPPNFEQEAELEDGTIVNQMLTNLPKGVYDRVINEPWFKEILNMSNDDVMSYHYAAGVDFEDEEGVKKAKENFNKDTGGKKPTSQEAISGRTYQQIDMVVNRIAKILDDNGIDYTYTPEGFDEQDTFLDLVSGQPVFGSNKEKENVNNNRYSHIYDKAKERGNNVYIGEGLPEDFEGDINDPNLKWLKQLRRRKYKASFNK